MLFRVISKDQFDDLLRLLLRDNEVIGPKQVATDKRGKPVHQFVPVSGIDELDLGYETTEFSAKTYFLPFQETLSSFSFMDGDWEQQIRYRVQPRAIVGLHACDINGLVRLDKVFSRDLFPSPYYLSRRKNTFVVGIDHEPCAGGFCRSVGADTVTHGFDLFLTDLGERYFVAIDSDRGFQALQKVGMAEVTPEDTHAYHQVRKRIAAGFSTEVSVHNLENVLDIEFDSEVWRRWGAKCLSCGSCAMVCPTCYCYGVSERVSLDFTSGAKVKKLYSCNLHDFAEVAGGHNFRPTKEKRLKYRYYHQHRGFVETYDEPKCVGCNRCGRVCLAGINPPEIIRELKAENAP